MKKNKRPFKKSFSVIVDGQTEKWYLDLLKKYEKNKLPRIDIKPEIPKKQKLKALYQQVKENSTIYDKVIWVIDFDVILKNNQTHEFEKYYKQLSKKRNVEILVNNPCFEFWILLHFKETSRIYSKCCDIESEIKERKFLVDYKKTEKFYKKQNNDVYKKLKYLQEVAIENGGKLGKIDFKNIKDAKAELYRIFEIMGMFFESDDSKK